MKNIILNFGYSDVGDKVMLVQNNDDIFPHVGDFSM